MLLFKNLRFQEFLLGTAVLLLLIPRAVAEVPQAQDPNHFCTSLSQGRDQLSRVNRFTVIRDGVRLMMDPSHLVRFQKWSAPISESYRVKPMESPPNSMGALPKNLIFSIDPPEEWVNRVDLAKMRKDYSDLNDEIRKYDSIMMRLIFAPSIQACVSRIQSAHFDPDLYSGLIQRRSNYRLIEQIDEGARARTAISKALRKARLPWTVIPVTDLNEVYRALQDPAVENVVILSHGLSGGKLIDSRYDSYPLGFFNPPSPALRTISIFACHGNESESIYHIVKGLKESPSIHPERALFLSVGSVLGGREESVPVSAFRGFMKKVENSIRNLQYAELRVRPTQNPYPIESPCRIHLKDFEVIRGTVGMLVNGRFIGSVQKAEAPVEFLFPCHFMKEGSNILVAQSLSAIESSEVRGHSFSFEIESPEGRIHLGPLQNFLRADQSYQGSRMDFTWKRSTSNL